MTFTDAEDGAEFLYMRGVLMLSGQQTVLLNHRLSIMKASEVIFQGSGRHIHPTIWKLHTSTQALPVCCACWEKLKTDYGQTHVDATFCRRTYMRPPSVGMMATSAVTVTATLFIVPKSLLSFYLLQPS